MPGFDSWDTRKLLLALGNIIEILLERGVPSLQVIECVIANGVPVFQNLFKYLWVFSYIVANAKKGGPGLVFL